ncbi:Kae1-associated serine/threonine protein kinase [Candidatus Woesearchaeota archaeon]|nr:Kae1-associated serine/threonine protein kinase [Candidatus Woesearchaeota archaeon]
MELIAQGAEAKVYSEGHKIIKERTPKTYRLKEIDEELRKTRTRREAKICEAIRKAGVRAPRLIAVSEKYMSLTIEKVEGEKLSSALNSENSRDLCRQIGEMTGRMHAANIVHNDLTTSNMILHNGKVYFIDFGLSLVSAKAEDRAVDLHLFRQALEGRHHNIAKECFEQAIRAYVLSYTGHKEVLARLQKVELRGRNKSKELI